MSYQSIVEMASSPSLKARVVAAAASEGLLTPQPWVDQRIWMIVAHDDEWAARWDDANFNYNKTFNPETGERPDVITDALVLSVVQEVMAEEMVPGSA